jgi:HAD superfamily hydrolase (TIGR01490 family)
MMQRIAFYDLDRTITRYPTYLPFLAYAVRTRSPWRILFAPVAAVGAIFYAMKAVNRSRLKEFNFRLFVGKSVSVADMDRMAEGFAERNLLRNTLKAATERIAADRAEGYRVVIATASFGFYTRAYAKLLGIDDVVATGAHVHEGDLFGRLDGDNCFGETKLAMVGNWLNEQGIDREHAHVRFYSDHHSDHHCLAWADEAFAANPNRPLRRMAAARDWPVLEWRRLPQA